MVPLKHEFEKIPMFDVHTHVDAEHMTARGLDDILLYHMVGTELYSSGCPTGDRLSEDPTDEERIARIEEAIPYIKNIENTFIFWGVRRILKELYEWDKPITLENWRELDSIIRRKAADPSWAREILRRANVCGLTTEKWRGHGGIADDIMVYSLEWAMFNRAQYKVYDTTLIELEYAWTQDEPAPPIPVTADVRSLPGVGRIRTIEDVYAALDHYCSRIPKDVLSNAQHFSTDLDYTPVTEDQMVEALKNRDHAGEKECNIYGSFVLHEFLKRCEKDCPQIAFQYSFGAEPLRYETGAKLSSKSLFQFVEVANRFPKINFVAFNASDSDDHAFCSVIRETPNLYAAGFWWHCFFPAVIEKEMDMRLDMLPNNKFLGYFSDAYCLDWLYAKATFVRSMYANVFQKRIDRGQLNEESACLLFRKIVHDNPLAFYRLSEKFNR